MKQHSWGAEVTYKNDLGTPGRRVLALYKAATCQNCGVVRVSEKATYDDPWFVYYKTTRGRTALRPECRGKK